MSVVYWVLNPDHTFREARTREEGLRQFESADRVVAQTKFPDGASVSTVFLVFDHSFGSGSDPILFETMIFGKSDDRDYQWRWLTWGQAHAGHFRIVNALLNDIDPDTLVFP